MVGGNNGFETIVTQTGPTTAAVPNTVNERNVLDGNNGLNTLGQGDTGMGVTTTQTGGGEFRVVEVNNILDNTNSGFVAGSDIPTPSSSGNMGFQPTGDINTAFQTMTSKYNSNDKQY